MPAADASAATSVPFVAPNACPPSWPALHAGLSSGAFDGNVSVLVGGNLRTSGSAAGAEGTVVALGDATFARDVPGAYEVGVTALGSQVTPFAGSDMLAVGGTLTGALGTHVDVGQGLGGDVVVGGSVAPGTDLDAHGGRVDTGIPDATAPYVDLAGQLAPKSAAYAALAPTGTVDVTHDSVVLTGDGVSNVQVFTVDGAALGARSDRGHGEVRSDGEPFGRSLQLVGVPQDAAVVVNLTGAAVDVDIDSLLTPDGLPLDPMTDPSFGGLATHVLWNAPSATSVDIGGVAQLPGSWLVPTVPSTTTISSLGTNGRILVAGDLVHTGVGELHAYPYLPDAQLICASDPVHLTTLTLGVTLVDPDHVVDPDRFFEGDFDCTLNGQNVTPDDNTWRMHAGATPRVLSDHIPSGATCTVTERLEAPPAPFRSWAGTGIAPDVVVVAKRQALGFVITNKVKELATTPTETPTQTPTDTPTQTPTETVAPPPSPTQAPTPTPTPTPSSIPDPTSRPPLTSSPSALPTETPASTPPPTVDTEAPHADAPNHGGPAGPMTTTAPFTLRGAFVWAPVMMLSLLTLVLRVRRRPRRLH